MRRATVALVCAALVGMLVGAGYWLGARSDDAADSIDVAAVRRRCIDWTTQAPTASELYGGCGEPGDVLIGFAVTECVSGPELFAGDVGWGYVGETMTVGRVSEDVRAQCDGFADASRE